ncbi:alpha/beta fold hydrolase [Altererythrobacter gangjinensis]|uniref:Alpha/beta fold hydrolase n=2 Tax=Pontixanthobacter gangjinensis TaxID=1028742 RepID=A0A6I4SPU3_9SPHN|nr:alpha/beta fold hydrolase [Pontixanthobacter gangjinensis]
MTGPVVQGQIDADGCSINYFEWGKRGNPPLILLHGFLAHAGCWAAIAPSLAVGRHVVAYDLSGMGDSGRRETYTVEDRVAELMEVARQTGQFDHAVKPVIVAHSYGGSVTLSALEQHHDAFSGAIICDLMAMRPETLARHFKRNRRPGSQDPDRPNKVYPDYEAARGRYVLSPPQEAGVPYLVDYMAYHSLSQVAGGWRWKFDPEVFRRDPKMESSWQRTPERIIEAPGRKAVIYGEQSLLFNADSAAYLRELGGIDFPIISVPQAQHHLMLDQPVAMIAALRSVLESWTAADCRASSD